MTMKTVAFVMTGPPTANAGAFVAVVDDAGNRIDDKLGWWQHDGQHWRFVMPVELVPRLSAAIQAEVERVQAGELSGAYVYRYRYREPPAAAVAGAGRAASTSTSTSTNAGMSARESLKAKLRSAPKKEVPAPMSEATPSHWETCPSCSEKFDPARDELLDCGNCSESKCTAKCLPDPARPCLDCAALTASPEEGGFDASAAPPTLFRPGWTAATIAAKGAADGDDGGDDDDDE